MTTEGQSLSSLLYRNEKKDKVSWSPLKKISNLHREKKKQEKEQKKKAAKIKVV